MDESAYPDPPTLDDSIALARRGDDDIDVDAEAARREDIALMLGDGAWNDGFAEWLEFTDLSSDEIGLSMDMSLFSRYDFFWNSAVERIEFRAPKVAPADLGSTVENVDRSTVEDLNVALIELGHIVRRVLEESYVDWEEMRDPDGTDEETEFDSLDG